MASDPSATSRLSPPALGRLDFARLLSEGPTEREKVPMDRLIPDVEGDDEATERPYKHVDPEVRLGAGDKPRKMS